MNANPLVESPINININLKKFFQFFKNESHV